MAMADGYAQASRSLGVVNLHISCGLGNAMGMLYNAYRAGTPLMVTAGQQDRRLMFEEPILWSDMVQVARPWTKWAEEVERVEDLPVAIRRAVANGADAADAGRSFCRCRWTCKREIAEARPDASSSRSTRTSVRRRPHCGRPRKCWQRAKNPAILVGSRVVEADAVDRDWWRVAERLGAPVIHGVGHDARAAGLSGRPSAVRPGIAACGRRKCAQRLDEFDVLLVVGMDLLRLVRLLTSRPGPCPSTCGSFISIEDPWQLGKNYPSEVGLIGDPQDGLARIGRLARRIDDARGGRSGEDARRRASRDASPRSARTYGSRPIGRKTPAGDAAGADVEPGARLADERGGD